MAYAITYPKGLTEKDFALVFEAHSNGTFKDSSELLTALSPSTYSELPRALGALFHLAKEHPAELTGAYGRLIEQAASMNTFDMAGPPWNLLLLTLTVANSEFPQCQLIPTMGSESDDNGGVHHFRYPLFDLLPLQKTALYTHLEDIDMVLGYSTDALQSVINFKRLPLDEPVPMAPLVDSPKFWAQLSNDMRLLSPGNGFTTCFSLIKDALPSLTEKIALQQAIDEHSPAPATLAPKRRI